MIRTTEVNGILTLVAPTLGPMRAGLVFRVGQADEQLPNRGITHLVEHLAVHGANHDQGHVNASTAMTMTQFLAQGSPETISDVLNGICTNLNAPPMGRLPTEREILRVEAASRSTVGASRMALWRHGARDFGLSSYPEWGLETVTAEKIENWTQTWFTRQNAVLWIAGDTVPAGLRPRLPDGARQPTPRPSSALPVTPAYFGGPPDIIVFDCVVARTTAAVAYARVLQRRLFRRLREELGYSYLVTVDYQPRDRDTAIVTALVDVLPENHDLASRQVVEVFRRLADTPPDRKDLDKVVASALETLSEPDVLADSLPSHASNILAGAQNPTLEELRTEWTELREDGLQRVAAEALESTLAMVQVGSGLEWAGFEQAPRYSSRAIIGTAYRSELDHSESLVIGRDGVSMVGPYGPATVRFAECAAALAWPDGARQLIGTDAIAVSIEPTITPVSAAALTAVDAAIPATVVVPLPERAPSDIPSVPTSPSGLLVGRKAMQRRFSAPRLRDHDARLLVLMGIAVTGTTAIVIAVAGSPSRPGDSRDKAPVARVTFGPVGLAAPERIGALTKMTEPHPATANRTNPLVAVANQSEILPEVSGNRPIRPKKIIPYSALYEHTMTPSRQVVVWGGVGPGASDPFQSTLALAAALRPIPRAREEARADLRWRGSTGRGGCRSMVGDTRTVVVCTWTGQNVAVIMEFAGFPLDESVHLMGTMLDSIVQIR
jgi:predicted Zn-dependent peptidase